MAATSAMSSSVAMLLALRVRAERGREKKRPWQYPPSPRTSPSRSAWAASMETNRVGAARGFREGWGKGVATARSSDTLGLSALGHHAGDGTGLGDSLRLMRGHGARRALSEDTFRMYVGAAVAGAATAGVERVVGPAAAVDAG
eukprot:1392937-Pleurochrysis_carterae.AAC.1